MAAMTREDKVLTGAFAATVLAVAALALAGPRLMFGEPLPDANLDRLQPYMRHLHVSRPMCTRMVTGQAMMGQVGQPMSGAILEVTDIDGDVLERVVVADDGFWTARLPAPCCETEPIDWGLDELRYSFIGWRQPYQATDIPVEGGE